MKPLKLLGALVAAAMLTGVTNIMAYDIPVSVISDASQMKKSSIENLKEDTRVFKINKNIQVMKVVFTNHYGFDVAGHLYLPENFDSSKIQCCSDFRPVRCSQGTGIRSLCPGTGIKRFCNSSL